MGARFYITFLVCLKMAGPALAGVGFAPYVRILNCPDAVLNALVVDSSLDYEIARDELIPALHKMVVGQHGTQNTHWARWPVNASRSQSDRLEPLRERLVVRLNGILRDLTRHELKTLVLPVQAAAQRDVLERLESTNPIYEVPPEMPRWRLRPSHVWSGAKASATVMAGTSVLLNWPLAWDALVAAAAALGWATGRSLYDLEAAQQRAYQGHESSPDNTYFFLSLKKHDELVTQPKQFGDWEYSSINFEQNSNPLYVDLVTRVAQSESGLKGVTWLILRRP